MHENHIESRPDIRKFRGRGNRGGRGNFMSRGGMKGPMPFVHEKFRDQPMNGAIPYRRGMGRMHPYQNPRGRGAIRGHPGFMPPPPPLQFEREMREPFPPPALRRGHLPPPPPGLRGFRGMPPPPRGRGILLPLPPPPPHRGRFPHPRGFPNGRGPAAHPPPPGRGHRWPAPPGGRRF